MDGQKLLTLTIVLKITIFRSVLKLHEYSFTRKLNNSGYY